MNRDSLFKHCHAYNSIPCIAWCNSPIEHMHIIFIFDYIAIFAKKIKLSFVMFMGAS